VAENLGISDRFDSSTRSFLVASEVFLLHRETSRSAGGAARNVDLDSFLPLTLTPSPSPSAWLSFHSQSKRSPSPLFPPPSEVGLTTGSPPQGHPPLLLDRLTRRPLHPSRFNDPPNAKTKVHKSRGTLCSLISSYASFIRSQPSHASSPFPSFSCSLLVVSSLCLPHFRPPLITRASYVLLHRMPWCLHAP